MANRCAACGLRADQIRRHKLANVGLHMFPSDPAQRRAWEEFCGGGGVDGNGSGGPLVAKFMCSDHFTDGDYRTGTKQSNPERRRFLRDGAVPTIREAVSLKKALRKANRKPKRVVKYLKAESQLQPVPDVKVKIEHVCRICDSGTALQDIFQEGNAELVRRFSVLTSIEIEAPSWFCRACLGRLNDAYDFVQQCIEAEGKRKSSLPVTEVKREPQDCLAEPLIELPCEQIKVEELIIGDDDDDDDDVSGDSASEPEEPKLHTCETCQATFPRKSELFAHFKTHGKSRFPCKLCDKAFARKCFLLEHLLSHKAEPTFFCSHCPNAYKTKTGLNIHVKTAHLGIKSFVCEECGKRFKQRTQLHQHAMVHMKNTGIPCPHCDQSFPTGMLYREHLLHRHDDAAAHEPSLLPFECDVCSRVFPNRVCLTNHKHVHRERTVLCNVCGKKYRTTTQMKVHMKLTHDAEQLFECERCGQKFKTAKSLKYHRTVAHEGG